MAESASRNEKRARRYVEEVLTLENVDAIDDIFAHPSEMNDIILRDGTSVETYDDVKRYFERIMSKFGEYTITVDSVVSAGEEVMIRWDVSGQITEEFLGVPATAKSFETHAATSFVFDDGNIVEAHDHVNFLDLMPEVAQVARQGIVREMRDGIVVVDEDGRIIDVNPATIEMFDRDRDDLLGEHVEGLLDGTTPPEPGESTVIAGPDDRRYFEVGVSPLTGQSGERIGMTLVVREVTERRRHVQQLEVLNRVLRHNLRNDLTVVKGVLAEVDAAHLPDPALLSTAREKADDLLTTAETARHIRDTLADIELRQYDLTSILDTLADRARETYPDATVVVSASETVTVEATTVVEDTLWELVENACDHAGETPHVELTVETCGEFGVVTVADNGPGIPSHERQVLERGEETDLQHGSGLGLWLVHWTLEASGGDISFDVDDGTTVRAMLPLAD